MGDIGEVIKGLRERVIKSAREGLIRRVMDEIIRGLIAGVMEIIKEGVSRGVREEVIDNLMADAIGSIIPSRMEEVIEGLNGKSSLGCKVEGTIFSISLKPSLSNY